MYLEYAVFIDSICLLFSSSISLDNSDLMVVIIDIPVLWVVMCEFLETNLESALR